MIRKATDYIIVHCSDTPASMNIGAGEIRRWHVEENGWADIGYHYVIRRGGAVEEGRDLDAVGAHARGYNDRSVGVCMVGGMGADRKPDCNFTAAQWAALDELIAQTLLEFPGAEVIGHRDVSPKACPAFDVKSWRV